jgi:predicted amidohydrolase
MAVSNRSVRIASVQWQACSQGGADRFLERIDYFVRTAADYRADFVVFPEWFTLELVEPSASVDGQNTVGRSSAHTNMLTERCSALSQSFRVNIIAGAHLRLDEAGVARNTSYVFLRDGSLHVRDKLHPTPFERETLGVIGGDDARVIETDCGPVGVMICYDIEFPEAARHLTDQGARIFFVPYCTDTSHGHLRVRYCCHARTVENQCYVVTSGIIGRFENLPEPFGNYAQSAILTPSDLPFARDGIAAEASANTEMIIFADLDLDALDTAKRTGTVRNLDDRRPDLYTVDWKGNSPGSPH